jgi:hypothetical protein
MTFDDFTDILRDYLGKDNLDKVLDSLKVLLKPMENVHYQSLVALQRRQSVLRQEMYVAPLEFSNIERGRIGSAIYLLLDELEKDPEVVAYYEADWLRIVTECGIENEHPTRKIYQNLGLRLILHSEDKRAPGPLTELDCETMVGRRKDCLLHLNDECISRRHARIYYEEGQLWVEDFESDNGTFINDRQVIDRMPLVDGCKLRFYDIAFWVQIEA